MITILKIKKVMFILVLVVIIITSNIIELKYFAPKKEIKIVSYNIHSGLDKDMYPTLFDIIDFLRVSNADIICLQEVNESAKVGFQVSSLKEELKMNSHFGANVISYGRNYGLVTYSRYPIKTQKHVYLSSDDKEQRGLLHTTLNINGKKLDIINIHLGLGKKERKRQIEELLNFIKKLDSDNYVVLGDFNEDNIVFDERILRDVAKDLKKSNTLTFSAGLDRIDYVFVSPNIEVVSYDVLIKSMSDHYPIVAKIRI